MAPLLIFLVLLLHWSEQTESVISVSSHTPVSRIKLPHRIPEITYKGSIFSYTSNGRHASKPIRDYVLENESVKLLEESFVEYFTETIISKLNSHMRTGIPEMSIPPLEPLRLPPIQIEPTVGNDIISIRLEDVQISGLSSFKVSVTPKLQLLRTRLTLKMPQVSCSFQFSVNGSVWEVIQVNGAGHAELEYKDVVFRTELNLLHENNTFQVATSDPPILDYATAKIKLKAGSNESTDAGMASEIGPLLFWVLADHVVQEVDDYLLKFVNNNMMLFKVPDSFTPLVTWLMNRSGMSQNHHGMAPFQISRFSPFPFLNHWINSLSNLHRPSNLNNMNLNTRLFK